MDNVRVSVTIRNQRNTKRLTFHRDVPIEKAKAVAGEMASDMGKFFDKKKSAEAEDEG